MCCSCFCCVLVLQGDLEEALKKFQALIDENPRDFRPFLCQVSREPMNNETILLLARTVLADDDSLEVELSSISF